MTAIEVLLLNFEEIRRRSLKLWMALPETYYSWKPDEEAMSCLEMIRHVLEGEHLFHIIINKRGDLGNYSSPWDELPYTDVASELSFAGSYRIEFINTIRNFSPEDLGTIEIHRKEKNQKRKLGDYLLRMAY